VGTVAASGQQGQPRGEPVETHADEFPRFVDGTAVGYGVEDIAATTGWVSVGVSAETAQVAVSSMRHWWGHEGHEGLSSRPPGWWSPPSPAARTAPAPHSGRKTEPSSPETPEENSR
jgi:Rhodopirellula transposase DDE domain